MVHQSKWWFHPCARGVFHKLKRLNIALERARRQVATWKRWDRKHPNNRVSRKRIRNDQGQVIGYESPVPIPEPRLCPVFTDWHRLIRDGIADEYRNSRHPVAKPEMVKPLSISEEEIDRLLGLVK
jgi:hypothetical protein